MIELTHESNTSLGKFGSKVKEGCHLNKYGKNHDKCLQNLFETIKLPLHLVELSKIVDTLIKYKRMVEIEAFGVLICYINRIIILLKIRLS